ncbi:sugar phosphate nucleotidyltransferase [Paenibacillus sp. GCM10012307]|uniref:Cupin domain-containing protein n=1 Tax=Paenibacillus roseus TaxID=2798579 RepID=A0A934J1E6_9BACL|nr:sugar phosphate nucleotidyltransferase [Paenibacillus roseus]MBJ6359794.1 cupin domain-containing protein [Paenibacillus roseus]
MKLILLSGGSGKRLWPLSNDARSKQFLRILQGPADRKESMVERVWRQLGEAGLQHNAFIATGAAQEELLRSHVGLDVPIIMEPERRDTFPAIALAAVYLYSVAGMRLDEAVAILPVDPYVETSFFSKVHELEQVLKHSAAELALIGVKPTYPSEKYGYIVPEAQLAEPDSQAEEAYYHVSRFTEKPNAAQAEALIEQSAMWNCGVFAFKLGYLINLLIEKRLPIQYDELLKQYGTLRKTSFDYEVVEQAQRIVALPYDGFWKDLGTWNTLTEEMGVTLLGNGKMTEDSENTHIVNELGVPITVIGLSNVVVAASPDGILVSDKASSPRIKDVMKHDDHRPMFEERRWGRYFVLDHMESPEGDQVITKRVSLNAGKNFSYHYHNGRSEVWTIVSGEGQMVLDHRYHDVKAGDVIQIPAGCKHALHALSDMEVIEVMRGSQLDEDDIVRLGLEWEPILQFCTT